MPSPVIDYTVSAQERALSGLKQSQTAVVDVVDSWAKAVESTVQDLPAIPVASALPSVDELLSLQFDFAGKVLAAQRDFADRLVKAAAPAVKTTPVETPAVS
ncbi:MAG: hypothetical protein AB7V62_07155 [Thermoleophilia bacterium]